MTNSDPPNVKLKGRRGLLAAAPAMLGFHPRESMVMLCLAGPQRLVGPVMRVDLPRGDGGEQSGLAMAESFKEIAWEHADEVALLCYTDLPQTPPFALALIEELRTSGMVIVDAAKVTGDLSWSIPARPQCWDEAGVIDLDDGCGIPDDEDAQVQLMAAAIAFNGRSVLPDREALVRSIAGPVGVAAAEIGASLAEALDSVLIENETAFIRGRPDQVADPTVDTALRECLSGSLGPAICSRLVLLLWDHTIRDQVIGRTLLETDEPWLPMLIALARALPDDFAAEACAVLTVAAYRMGDGALAQVAVDRCLRIDPEHGLAVLMLRAMNGGLRPSALLGILGPDLGVSPGKDG